MSTATTIGLIRSHSLRSDPIRSYSYFNFRHWQHNTTNGRPFLCLLQWITLNEHQDSTAAVLIFTQHREYCYGMLDQVGVLLVKIYTYSANCGGQWQITTWCSHSGAAKFNHSYTPSHRNAIMPILKSQYVTTDRSTSSIADTWKEILNVLLNYDDDTKIRFNPVQDVALFINNWFSLSVSVSLL